MVRAMVSGLHVVVYGPARAKSFLIKLRPVAMCKLLSNE